MHFSSCSCHSIVSHDPYAEKCNVINDTSRQTRLEYFHLDIPNSSYEKNESTLTTYKNSENWERN